MSKARHGLPGPGPGPGDGTSAGPGRGTAVTNVRLAYAAAATLFLVGVFMLVRADETLQTVLGLALVVAGVGGAIAARTARTRHGH